MMATAGMHPDRIDALRPGQSAADQGSMIGAKGK
jgi:hypothetical protein